MKILYDYKIFYQQNAGGISNYFYNLGNEILKLNEDIRIYSPIHKNLYLKKIKYKKNKNYFIPNLPSVGKSFYENINHKLTDNFIKNFQPDIVHETYYSNKNYDKKCKTVCTVYDMINEIYPKNFSNSKIVSKMKLETIRRSDKIICISYKTKEDLINIFSINENKIDVVYLASGFSNNNSNINLKKRYSNFLLFVGSRYGYKNFENFIKAYSRSSILKNNFKLLFFGGEKISKFDYQVLNENKLNLSDILFLDDSNSNLEFLYKNVAALIYPSLYEGFGIPILEAMTFGCPVLSSDGGSLKEVGGDGIEYFDPNEIDDISHKLEKVLFSEKILRNQIEYGLKRCKKFSWKKCADKTLKIYRQ
jgi:glycosyltransferase involved in cell wall biosynthesis